MPAAHPTILDVTFTVLFTVVLMAYETVYEFPRFKARIAAGEPNARRHGYRRTVTGQWIIALIAIGIWIRSGRSWSDLGILPPDDTRLIIGIALALIFIAFF